MEKPISCIITFSNLEINANQKSKHKYDMHVKHRLDQTLCINKNNINIAPASLKNNSIWIQKCFNFLQKTSHYKMITHLYYLNLGIFLNDLKNINLFYLLSKSYLKNYQY